MEKLRILALLPAALLGLAASLSPSGSAHAEEWVGRSVTLAGRKVSCGKADILIDRNLPSEGGAGDTTLILNPNMLNKQPPTVRLFVFNHECGHISVGDSELDADCYAVDHGVREGWLDRSGLGQVCDSFEGAPETDSHPSAKRRCANLDRCFGRAVAQYQQLKPPAPVPAVMPTATASIGGAVPTLPVRKSIALGKEQRVISAWRCTDPIDTKTASADPIGQVISKDAERAEHCR